MTTAARKYLEDIPDSKKIIAMRHKPGNAPKTLGADKGCKVEKLQLCQKFPTVRS